MSDIVFPVSDRKQCLVGQLACQFGDTYSCINETDFACGNVYLHCDCPPLKADPDIAGAGVSSMPVPHVLSSAAIEQRASQAV